MCASFADQQGKGKGTGCCCLTSSAQYSWFGFLITQEKVCFLGLQREVRKLHLLRPSHPPQTRREAIRKEVVQGLWRAEGMDTPCPTAQVRSQVTGSVRVWNQEVLTPTQYSLTWMWGFSASTTKSRNGSKTLNRQMSNCCMKHIPGLGSYSHLSKHNQQSCALACRGL